MYEFINDKMNNRWPKYESEKRIELMFANKQPILPDSNQEMTESEHEELNQIILNAKLSP